LQRGGKSGVTEVLDLEIFTGELGHGVRFVGVVLRVLRKQ